MTVKILMLVSSVGIISSYKILVRNNCRFTVQPQILDKTGLNTYIGNKKYKPSDLEHEQTRSYEVDLGWSGRIWGRTYCDPSGHFVTGNYGNKTECNGYPVVTSAEFGFTDHNHHDFYDISLVDGYNLPMQIIPIANLFREAGNKTHDCNTIGCYKDLNTICPEVLSIKNHGSTVACMSACMRFGTDEYCCRGAHGTPQTCNSSSWPKNYPAIFKSLCPDAYSYPYDDDDSMFKCDGVDVFELVFCPKENENQIETKPKTNGSFKQDISILYVIIFTLFIVVLIIITRHFLKSCQPDQIKNKENRKGLENEDEEVKSILINHFIDIDYNNPKNEGEEPTISQNNEFIENSLLTKSEILLGEGNFGSVYEGSLRNKEDNNAIKVAVKTLKNGVDWNTVQYFINEGLWFYKHKHERILTPIGISIEDNGSPVIMLPLMKNGDLGAYLRKRDNVLTIVQLLQFAQQISEGMEYLSSKHIVHRDLAARNCLLDEKLCPKISDFGLSRIMYPKDYYRSNNMMDLPVKWMAIECIEDKVYNTQTDIWSFGVLFWEILSRGSEPYPTVNNANILVHIKNGNRLPEPQFCKDINLYNLLLKCWSVKPKLRSNFSFLTQFIITFIDINSSTNQNATISV